jgi:hypothetical protein
MCIGISLLVFACEIALAQTTAPSTQPSSGWTPLFNGKNLDGFYTFLPTPGKNNDPENYFKVENGMIHVMDLPPSDQKKEFGYFATEKNYDNYRLRFQYKWGEKRYVPRAKAKRDSGCLYHIIGDDHTWPKCIECQVQEGDTGDLWIVSAVGPVSSTVKSPDDKEKVFAPEGVPFTLTKGRIVKDPTVDSLTDWNNVEVIVKGNSSAHIVNGKLVNRATDFKIAETNQPLSSGRIGFQAEGSEVFYRNIEIRPLRADEQLPTSTASIQWEVNDRFRPLPPRAQPKSEGELAASSKPPANAIVLFDGKDLSAFEQSQWKHEDGYLEVVKKTADLITRQPFGSCRLHVEWCTPSPAKGKDQGKGNSGVMLMGKYEIQVLDNTENPTYADGLAGAVYGENPPLVDASRPSGEWNSYDITFQRPRFDAEGKLVEPAVATVYLNGVLVQDHFKLTGPTNHKVKLDYAPHADKLPLVLQNHGSAVRYRNIWILPEED